MAPKRGHGRPRKRTEPEIEAEVESTPSEPQRAESRQSTRLSVDERRKLEALWVGTVAYRAERAHSKSHVSTSVIPQASTQTPLLTPHKIVTRVPDDDGVSVQDFLKLKTPNFRGEEGEDLQEFLEEIDKMIQRLTYSEARVIELVGITMKGNAWEWYKKSIQDRLYTSNSLTWEEFKRQVMNEFLPPAERQSRASQFEKLRQLPEMTVVEYAQEFIRLRKYAPHMIPIEANKVERFRAGLIRPIYNAMVATDFPTLSTLVDKAKRWKGKRDEEKKEREQLRKIIEKGHEGKERKEETGAIARTTDRLPLYPHRGGKEKRKG